MFVNSELDPNQLSPLVLAYVGDAVFELFVRTRLAAHPAKVQELHRQAVSFVQAAGQAEIIRSLEPDLTVEERDLVRRGRNAKGAVPRHGDTLEYRYSTGFEALLGYLYLKGRQERLLELLNKTALT